jgi:hypothetical protein
LKDKRIKRSADMIIIGAMLIYGIIRSTGFHLRSKKMLQNLLQSIDQNRESITTAQAAQRSDLSQVYLAQLLREHKLEGFQLGRDWYVYTDSLEAFLKQKRKPGPKGPRKKPTQTRPNVQNTDLPGTS